MAFSSSTSWSQNYTIEGTIKDNNGAALPYATIYIRNLKTGSTANDLGFYRIQLAPGTYDLVFQYLGFETHIETISITSQNVQKDIALKPVVYQLKSVAVHGGKEDPSYTVIRKAIAKANYHLNQLDEYTAKVYIKGSGRLLDSPGLFRKMVEKQGIDSNMAFVSETELEATFRRPNHYEQRIISARESGNDNDADPNMFIFGSFYEPNLEEAISPLSPRAFAYYRFKYEGFFTDRGYTVNKIKVIPRSKGDNLFYGYIYILEDKWSIYKVDLSVISYGIEMQVQQNYNPIEEDVWLPVHFKIDVDGTFFGFDFTYEYLATVSDYQITRNPDLDVELTVIDENIDEEEAKELASKNTSMDSLLLQGQDQELTRKQLRQLMKEYEKEELKAEDAENITSNYTITYDSLANKRDSSYWESIRSVPLNSFEIEGYRRLDSIAEVQAAKEDSIQKPSGFKWYEVFTGGYLKLDSNHYIITHSMLDLIQFNTVDGWVLGYKASYRYRPSKSRQFFITPEVRYAFDRKAWNYQLKSQYRYGRGLNRGTIAASGGRFVDQFNSQNPITPLVNTFTTLFLNQNFMKIYEQNFVKVQWAHPVGKKLKINVSSMWAQRKELDNTTNYTFIDWESREFTSNQPDNIELDNQTGFPIHQAWITTASLAYRPWQKIRIINGVSRAIASSSPTFTLDYTKGIEAGDAVVDFDHLSLRADWRGNIGARGELGISLEGGTFLNTDRMYFIDFKHFSGNRTPFAASNPTDNYRLLPYYTYSTKQSYFSAFAHFQPRKLLLTQFVFLRMTGLKENLFISYLGTENSRNYTEIGYTFDNLFRLFRLEVAWAFQDGAFTDSGMRVGIATLISF
jgi:hypothetical protein